MQNTQNTLTEDDIETNKYRFTAAQTNFYHKRFSFLYYSAPDPKKFFVRILALCVPLRS